jgi:hypothetical protein
MIGTTHVSRGTRGDYDPSTRPGDLTGRRLLAQAGAKEDRDAALANTRNALISDPVTEVKLDGGRSYLVPVEVVNHLLRVGAEED